MNLRRCFTLLLCLVCFSLSMPSLSYADIATDNELHLDPPTWQEAVEAVKASRQVATASDADEIEMYELENEDYGISLLSSVGTVTNTVDRTGISVWFEYEDASGNIKSGRSYVNADGSFKLDFPGGSLIRFSFDFASTALPSAGTYDFSFDFSSDFSFDYKNLVLQILRDSANVAREVFSTSSLISRCVVSSGDLYFSPYTVKLGSYGSQDNGFGVAIRPVPDSLKDVFSGSVRFCFEANRDGSAQFSDSTYDDSMESQSYHSNVSSGLSSIGDTLEEIVETISLQLEALWNQMYNYIHLPEYQKLEEIRQAIENIRLDVDVDNTGVINKLDEQIKNDNSNTTKVEQAVEKHGNFIIEGLKSLFIPDETYFSSLFDRINQFFSDRLGFLYTPVYLVIQILQAFISADSLISGIPFPGIVVGEWVLLEPQTVNFDILDNFEGLHDIIYFATDTVMIGAFLSLLHRKYREVFNS